MENPLLLCVTMQHIIMNVDALRSAHRSPGKAAGPDEVMVEMIKALREAKIHWLT